MNENRTDPTELQQLADAACYAAKEAGRNRVQIVADKNDKVDEQRGGMRWAHRLHDAMLNDKFVLYGQQIQPLGKNRDGEIFEILLRLWDADNQRLIPPGAFLPSAERYGLSVDLDKWVVSNLMKSLDAAALPTGNTRRFWVNLSGSSLDDPEFSRFLIELIKNSKLPRGTISFEITETVVTRNMSNARQLIDELRKLGCEIALDDFGTGLSSLLYLKTLNIDYVKIDGSFVKDISTDTVNRLFVKSSIDIAHHLGIKAVAEHVENDEIRDIVASLGADYGPGFGIHCPTDLVGDILVPDSNYAG